MQTTTSHGTSKYSWDNLPESTELLKRCYDHAVAINDQVNVALTKEEIDEQIERENQLHVLIEKVITEGMESLILANARGDQWALVLPDASEAGAFRWQSFDVKGFIGHATYPTLLDTIKEAFHSGYRTLDMEALYRVSDLPSFRRGNEVLAEVQALNAGQISFEQYIARVAEINKRYETALAA